MESISAAAVPEKAAIGESYCAGGGTDPSLSMSFAVSFDHSCSPPQCGQPIRPTNDGSLANEDFSISIPVSIIRPVTLHGVSIFHIGAPFPSTGEPILMRMMFLALLNLTQRRPDRALPDGHMNGRPAFTFGAS
jgi:hypothetical protein